MKPINRLLFLDDLKLYGASKDQLDSLVQLVRIFSQDINMLFGLDKCAVLEMRRRRQVSSSGIELPDDQHIGEIEEDGYKYLGIITWKYIRRVKKVCRSKLNGGNLIDGINTWAVGVERYSAGIVDWTMEEVANMEGTTRKILAMNGCLHTRSDVARPYLPRKEGGRGLIGIEECVRRESKSLHGYLRESTEWMLQAALKEKMIVEEESLQDYERRRKDEKVKNWKEKSLHGAFVQQISDEAGEESWRWLRNGFLKKETQMFHSCCSETSFKNKLDQVQHR